MKKIKIIANPKSGREQALTKINQLINLFSEDGYKIDLRFTKKRNDGMIFAEEDEGEDLIICYGGDGTLNEVVNGIYHRNRKVPLAILAGGTVNDFATFLDLPTNIRDFYDMIKANNQIDVDLGMAGERVFANVAAAGLLTEVAYTVSDDLKSKIGRMAYYFEGIKEFARLRQMDDRDLIKAKIKSEELESEEEIHMFLVANSASVGGFKKIAPKAEVYDGYLDVVILKGITSGEVLEIAPSILSGKHIDHNKIIYLKTKEITIETDKKLVVDVDGEKAGELPMTFKVLDKALKLIVRGGD
ncbi:diacylglycerol/lipid kinase family protein [Peptoniphilus stercorisuis]|uniref:Diacylglycerol kinase (ATP) n=1 Tax=Peptoniphilus stercorisuis TaxID=1436965 RepID=A0ABS4KEI1_9FIRM|nr:diacylglycerol kinase family protein [Peptoniphilus stercorisuis]MBP2026177.1 diacylglycerol kinase (ATP) [Peptoniphilus stercorisuis]